MITLQSVTKSYRRGGIQRTVLDSVDAVFEPRSHYVILGQRGAGKTTLLRMIGDLQQATLGTIKRYGTISLPLGSSIMPGDMTGRQMVALVSDLYSAVPQEILEFVIGFSELGAAIDLPVLALQADSRLRLFYAIGYAIPVDFYLFDGTVAVGDAVFQARCRAAFEQRRKTAGTIFATRDPRQARVYGDRAMLLHGGKLFLCDSVEEAVDAFERLEVNAKHGTLSYAEALIKRGDAATAQEYLLQYIPGAEDDVPAYMMLAEVALKAGQLDEAADACRAALELAPDQSESHAVLAKIAMARKEFDDAIYHATEALQIEPQDRNTAMLLAKAYESAALNTKAAMVWRHLGEREQNSLYLRMAIRCDSKAENWNGVLEDIEAIRGAGTWDDSLFDWQLQALIKAERTDEACDVIVDLAGWDLEKAVTKTYLLAKDEKWPVVVRLLDVLLKYDISKYRSSRTCAYLLALLDRRATALQKEGNKVEAARFFQLVRAIDPTRQLSGPSEIQETGIAPAASAVIPSAGDLRANDAWKLPEHSRPGQGGRDR